MTIEVEVESWCKPTCKFFTLNEEKFFSYDELAMVMRSCENLEICRNAVKFYKEDENVRSSLSE